MKQFIRDYLTFNKRERNGLFVLLTIITLMFVYLNISHLFVKHEVVDFTKFEKEIEEFNASRKIINDSLKSVNYNDKVKENTANLKAEYFIFDPNNLPHADWKRLGFTDKQIKGIKNYESKGGKFFNKNDLKKMYCISEKQYLLLDPFILIPDLKNNFQALHKTKSAINSSQSAIIDLNHADSAKLISINGIGGFYAKEIIKYREQLGGYYAKEQLLEIWKFDETKLKTMENKIVVDSTVIKKININTCDAKQLKHPYLKWNQVNGIINYRSKHGNYNSINQIKNTDLIDEATFKNISHYLIVE